MFDLYNEVFKKSRKDNFVFEPVEALRRKLLRNKTVINVTDLGAGSQVNTSAQRSIATITASTSKKPKQARFLATLARYLRCKKIVELGTSVGITTAYLGIKNPGSAIVSIEGCPEIYALAIDNFEKLGLGNITTINANFDDVLERELTGGFDLLYIDGNHTMAATLRYFELAKKYAHNQSVIVFDDIYWSEDMTAAWKKIIEDKNITASIDAFTFGIVFFREESSKQHFILKL